MRKGIVAFLLAIFLVMVPTPVNADTCLKVEPVISQTTCVKTPLDPLINGLVPETAPSNNPPTKPPSNNNGGSSGGSSGSGGGSVSKAPKVSKPDTNKGAVTPKSGSTDKPKAKKPKATKTTPTPRERVVIIKEKETEYEFKTYPWYFWLTIVFTSLGVGFLLFKDTEPDDDKLRPTVDKHKHDLL